MCEIFGEYMMKTLIIIGIIILTSFIGCSNSVSPEDENIIYFNSFETVADFENWNGLNENNWKSEVPPNCGYRSVLISGGCVMPHTKYVFQKTLLPGNYTIECLGKATKNSSGGGVTLKCDNSSVSISIIDSVWAYKTSETIFLPQTMSLEIEVNSGGFIHGGMLIDKLIVRKMN